MPERHGARDRVALGTIVNTHGIRGELRMLPHNPNSEALAAGAEIGLRRGAATTTFVVRAIRPHKRFLLLTLDGIDSMTAAAALVGAEVDIDATVLAPTAEGEVYHFDLIGLRVLTTAGGELGAVEEVFSTGASDVLVVRGRGRELLIPFIENVVREIDVAGGRLIIEPLPGLLD